MHAHFNRTASTFKLEIDCEIDKEMICKGILLGSARILAGNENGPFTGYIEPDFLVTYTC